MSSDLELKYRLFVSAISSRAFPRGEKFEVEDILRGQPRIDLWLAAFSIRARGEYVVAGVFDSRAAATRAAWEMIGKVNEAYPAEDLDPVILRWDGIQLTEMPASLVGILRVGLARHFGVDEACVFILPRRGGDLRVARGQDTRGRDVIVAWGDPSKLTADAILQADVEERHPSEFRFDPPRRAWFRVARRDRGGRRLDPDARLKGIRIGQMVLVATKSDEAILGRVDEIEPRAITVNGMRITSGRISFVKIL